MSVPSSSLHPRHGIHAPITGTGPRAAGSVRRTSTIDSVRPDGADGPVHLHGHARDVRTIDRAGRPQTVAEASLDVVAVDDQVVQIASTPAVSGLDTLRGASIRRGFRQRAAAAVPAEFASRSPLGLLLDDVVGAFLVSAVATSRMAGYDLSRSSPPREQVARQQDICAGWRAGGTIMIEVDRGLPPPDVTGPRAGPLAATDDPWSWHELRPLTPHAMRRARRTDVLEGEPVPVDAYFRDSHVEADGQHRAIHEYSVAAAVANGRFTQLEAVAHTLPWLECPAAVASASRLVGTPFDDLRTRVRADFVGTSTCTHLNDMLRSLEDLRALLPLRTSRE